MMDPFLTSLVPRLYIKLPELLAELLSIALASTAVGIGMSLFSPEPFIVWTRTGMTEGINHESAHRAVARGDRGRASLAHWHKIEQFYPDTGPLRRELYVKHLQFFEAGAQAFPNDASWPPTA